MTYPMVQSPPLVLIILDGFGYSTAEKYNAIATAHTPQWDEWWQHCPHLLLEASGPAVGLPINQMGNSEVGHMHIAAGRVIEQDFTRINNAIACGDFDKNPLFQQMIAKLKQTKKSLHVMGLLSQGGVHSHEDHLFAFIELCYQQQFDDLSLHLFLDGRDTPPKSVLQSLDLLEQLIKNHPGTQIRSLSGRYYAMDRDKRWERVEPVYRLIMEGDSSYHFVDASAAIAHYYQDNVTDEFIPATAIGKRQPIQDGDAIFFFNFRADRARQLTSAFIDPNFRGFERQHSPNLSYFVSMTTYDKTLATSVAFPSEPLQNTLGEVLAKNGLRQLRLAETEKYAHVTFFFNGGVETVFPLEERLLIPSPKVATYDLFPEMSAIALTDALIDALSRKEYQVIICNFANADMVGHSGNFQASVHAIECLDRCLKQIWEALAKQNGILLITADHGNAELMFDESTHQPHTAHTSEPVPFLCVGHDYKPCYQMGSLVDIAPTVLHLLGIEPPKEMTGQILLEKSHDE